MISFLRVLKFAFQDIGRNIGLSFMTIFILILMLLSVNILWSLDTITKNAVISVKNQIDVSFYFSIDASDADVKAVKNAVDSFSEVEETKLLSADEVLDDFMERHKNQQETIQALTELGSNPFGPTLIVKTTEPEDQNKIITFLDAPEYKKIIESRSFDKQDKAIERLQDITNKVERVGFGLTVLFAIISFLIIFNTIRAAINSQRVEISIKRLVGASNWFIRGPYLIEALLFTAISVALAFAIVFFSFNWLDMYMASVFPQGFSLTNYYKSNIFLLCGIQATAVLLLTVISSGLAMRKQLKV
ncbi:MAG: permease-like cell division protein FtsX [bacterium]